ncbi:hypothetical protein MA16_Dca025134 [Dendrobium catenatum]|uniref:Uncharacterized protein n=1 Tax=Dendrobium catenatum TaxID=906689 RepID=A0A2I0VTD7_9ASPA|nr:hypothetical protein MA16_Dca025134 [Dendrobium catenatum]
MAGRKDWKEANSLQLNVQICRKFDIPLELTFNNFHEHVKNESDHIVDWRSDRDIFLYNGREMS